MQSFCLGTLLPSKNSDAEEERENCGQTAQEGNIGWDVLSAESTVCVCVGGGVPLGLHQ